MAGNKDNMVPIKRRKKIKLEDKALKSSDVLFTFFDYEIHSIMSRDELINKLEEI